MRMSYYTSYYNYWTAMNLEELKTYTLPFPKSECGATRAYKFRGSSYVYGAATTNRIYWALVVNNGKKHTCFELYYKFPNGTDDFAWHPLDWDILSRLFKVGKKKWAFGSARASKSWETECHVLNKDGRCILQYDTKMVKDSLYSLNRDNVRSTLPAKLIEEFEDIIGTTVAYKSHVKSRADASIIYQALYDLKNIGWKVWNNGYEEDKEETIGRIRAEEGVLANLNGEFQQCCDGAAEAMNRLSSKFGIEVQL